jgi:hypothetical protein
MTIARIILTLPVEGEDTATNPAVVDALNNLAAVMLVQAEDGLWTLGSPEAEEDGPTPSEYLRGIGSGMDYEVQIDKPSAFDAGVKVLYSRGRTHLVEVPRAIGEEHGYDVMMDFALDALDTDRSNLMDWQFEFDAALGRTTIAIFTKREV